MEDSAKNQEKGITGTNVLSSRRIKIPRRCSWQHGMTLNQKTKILRKDKMSLHLWPERMKNQKMGAHQKLNWTLMKKMRYTLLTHILNLRSSTDEESEDGCTSEAELDSDEENEV